MKPLAIVGIVLIVLGIGGLVIENVSFTERKTVLDVGPLKVQADDARLAAIDGIAKDVGRFTDNDAVPIVFWHLSGTLSFVPRGHKVSGWQKPRGLSRKTYFYIDPDGPLLDPALRFSEARKIRGEKGPVPFASGGRQKFPPPPAAGPWKKRGF